MEIEEAVVGAKVVSLRKFCEIKVGTNGVIVEDYGSGVTVAWDLPYRPAIPAGFTVEEVGDMWAVDPDCPVRDGFNKKKN